MLYNISAIDRRDLTAARNIDIMQVVSASMSTCLNGSWTMTLSTTEWLPYATRLFVGNIGEFVVTGIESRYVNRGVEPGEPVMVHTYTCMSSAWYDLTVTVNGPVSGTFASNERALRAILEDTPWSESDFVGFDAQSNFALELDSGTAWDQMSQFVASLNPTDENTTHIMTIPHITYVASSMEIGARDIHAQAVSVPTPGDVTIDLQSIEVKSATRRIDDMSVFDAFALADKNGTLYQNGYAFIKQANGYASLKKRGQVLAYYPTKIEQNDEFDFEESTSGAAAWARANGNRLTKPKIVYEVEMDDQASTSLMLGSYAKVIDGIGRSPFFDRAAEQENYIISELTIDLVTGSRKASLGAVSKYIPVTERKG